MDTSYPDTQGSYRPGLHRSAMHMRQLMSCFMEEFSRVLVIIPQEGAGQRVASAYVEVVFDNSDGRFPVSPWLQYVG